MLLPCCIRQGLPRRGPYLCQPLLEATHALKLRQVRCHSLQTASESSVSRSHLARSCIFTATSTVKSLSTCHQHLMASLVAEFALESGLFVMLAISPSSALAAATLASAAAVELWACCLWPAKPPSAPRTLPAPGSPSHRRTAKLTWRGNGDDLFQQILQPLHLILRKEISRSRKSYPPQRCTETLIQKTSLLSYLQFLLDLSKCGNGFKSASPCKACPSRPDYRPR